ncbi:glycogen debranching protein GlgX [Petropleomorpha daqingensis]|uniref:Glycogen operon protein n=1 Tax=Petropleomorpha daqingensis TaxID=2026353 RepID=A0A853CLZ1_9ACTN|nr:glycogen debranching protein GlgX [Petropleomorpha daqingensis]NYJ07552.1 glycogen operon protein [Petropleomorpha daqingensis]
MRVHRGSHYPLGATWDGRGVNVAVFSEVAEQVELCLFDDPADTTETERIALPGSTGGIRHGYFPDLRPGQLYGLRASGPYRPQDGPRCNPNKLLFDPYAKAVGRDIRHDDSQFGYDLGATDVDLTFNLRDSAATAPLAAVIDPAFTWGTDSRPVRALADTVVYELHVKGFTRRHPGVPEPLRGTYAGLASPAAIEHLVGLGVTAVELLPVHYRVSERFLVEQGLSNYWGYNTLGFFAPDPRLAAARDPHGVVREFKTMVATLHDAGIAVLLDVVYNHTAEGSERGPTLAFRGLDNAAYYHLADQRRYTYDVTGTGNTLNVGHPRTLQLITDSLRYWVQEMHVDGFRFDLAPALAREFRSYDRLSSFFDLLLQDPVLAPVYLVAEPWDVGDGGYEVGNFPVNWSEWNGRYRDTVRRFWAGAPQQLGDLATRVAGSADLYGDDGRRPSASINFVTVHDGFTLADLVSYERKHNEANQQDNRDGTDDNASWNCGVEGPTTDADITALRRRQVRNLLLTLVLSQGVPMLQAGDEFGHTQQGNNNAYCQDNELTWLDWEWDDERRALVDFTRQLLALRAAEPVFRRRNFFQGRPITGGDVKDIYWISPAGVEMQQGDWGTQLHGLGVLLVGEEISELDEQGRPIRGNSYLLLLNAGPDPVDFVLPARLGALDVEVVLDTSVQHPAGERVKDAYLMTSRSAAVLLVSRPAA